MLNIRIQGTPDDLEKFLSDFKKKYDVLNISKPYPMRGNSKLTSIYLRIRGEKNET